MACLPPGLAAILLLLSLQSELVAAAEVQPPQLEDSDFEFELKPSDLQAITMEVLQQHPLVSASPGIKAAFGYRNYRVSVDSANYTVGESANVVFYPHAESRGIKQAYQAFCNRDDPAGAWSCPSVQIRRYVKLDTQDFEVRVKGDIDLDGVMAITEATRPVAASAVADSSTADTVILILPVSGGYMVSWGSKAGYGAVMVQAQLRSAGNPANPEDWQATVMPESD